MNPFGVQHEPLSKSFTKLAPKLARALSATDPAKSVSMTEKLRHHAGSYRLAAGDVGRQGKLLSAGFPRAEAQKSTRPAARMLNDTVGRMGRKERVLP